MAALRVHTPPAVWHTPLPGELSGASPRSLTTNGAGAPVPVTATFCVAAFVLAFVTSPLFAPTLPGENRTNTGLLVTLPPFCVSVKEVPKPEPADVETR